MPIAGYSCKWGCKFFSTLEMVTLAHEEECTYDPSRKRCHTCDHHEWLDGGDYCNIWQEIGVDESDILGCDYGENANKGKKCPHWELKPLT